MILFIKILSTVLMLAILIWGIKKKLNAPMLLLIVGIIATAIIQIITGESILGKASTGNSFLDLFEYILSKFQSTLTNAGIIVMSTMGFVAYLNYIKASDMFAALVTKPLKRIKSKYMVLGGALCIMMLTGLVIPSAVSRATLFMATVYPVLRAMGLSRKSSASVIAFNTMFNAGPLNTLMTMVYNEINTGYNLVTHATQHELMILPICVVLIVIMHTLFQKHYDKTDPDDISSDNWKNPIDINEIGVPKFYAVFPILPLLFVFLFNSGLIPAASVTVPAACYLSFFIAFFINIIRNRKNIVNAFNSSIEYWLGMGKAMTSIIVLMTLASVFSSALVKIGGITAIMQGVSGIGGNSQIGVYLGAIMVGALYFITNSVTGSSSGHTPLYASMLGTLVTNNATLDKLIIIFIQGGNFGSTLSPVAGFNVVTSSLCNLEVTQLIKRNMIPAILAFVIVTTVTVLFCII